MAACVGLQIKKPSSWLRSWRVTTVQPWVHSSLPGLPAFLPLQSIYFLCTFWHPPSPTTALKPGAFLPRDTASLILAFLLPDTGLYFVVSADLELVMILLPWPVACREPCCLSTEDTKSRPLGLRWLSERVWCPGNRPTATQLCMWGWDRVWNTIWGWFAPYPTWSHSEWRPRTCRAGSFWN